MRKLLFSVIIPSYNRSKLLFEAISSVLHQRYKNWELIVVDDGSEPPAGSIVKQFDDERIRYIRQENSGKSAARNRGIAAAEGEYICFLDDDDFYDPYHLESIASIIQAADYPVALIRSEAHIQLGRILKPLPRMPKNLNGIRFVWQRGAAPFFFCFHRDILAKFRFDERFAFAQDVHLIIRALLHYPLYYTDKSTLALREHAQRSSNAQGRAQIRRLLEARLGVAADLMSQYENQLSKFLKRGDWAQWKSRAYLRAANLACRQGYIGMGLRYSRLALIKRPSWKNLWQVIRNFGHLLVPKTKAS